MILLKKLILVLLLFIPWNVLAIKASSYIVVDQDGGRVLEGSNINNKYLTASTSKILTAITALNYGNLDDTVLVGNEILTSFGSGIYIEVGEELTLDDLLYGLLLRSGNDAALAIANHVGGSVENFVFLMNEMAEMIGMKDSYFVNPSGLEERDGSGNSSTAYDMALLMRYALNNEDFKRITSTKEIIVKSSLKTYKWINKNKLLQSYEYCTGGKTGYTVKAHRTLVTSASKDDMNIIIVTFNDGDDFNDHRKLYDKYFNSYKVYKAIDKNVSYRDDMIINNDFKVIIKDGDKVDTKIIIDSSNSYVEGSIGGRIDVLLNGEVIGYRYLYYKGKEITKDKSFLSKLKELFSL